MHYRILADIVVVIHFLFILFVLFGGILAFYRKWIIWVHLPVVAWGVLISIYGWICPLTPLENWLRHAGGLRGYGGGFIDHYLWSAIYPEGLTRPMQFVIAAAVLTINVAVYSILIAQVKKRKRTTGTAEPAPAVKSDDDDILRR